MKIIKTGKRPTTGTSQWKNSQGMEFEWVYIAYKALIHQEITSFITEAEKQKEKMKFKISLSLLSWHSCLCGTWEWLLQTKFW